MRLALMALIAGASAGCARPIPPEIIAFEAPDRAERDTLVIFTAQINERATEPVRLQWDFGSGYEDRGLRVGHAFATEGTHRVRFVAQNEAGRAERTWTLRIGPEPAERLPSPQIATVSITPNPARVGDTVQYAVRIAGTAPARATWTLGDGTTLQEAAPTHQYERPGTYAVTVRVESETGTDTRTVQLEVEPLRPAFCEAPVAANPVYFARNASVLRDDAVPALHENIALIRACTQLPVDVAGRAGAYERNAEALAADRAAAVAAFYEQAGIAPGRIRMTHQVVPGTGKTPKESATDAQRVASTVQPRTARR